MSLAKMTSILQSGEFIFNFFLEICLHLMFDSTSNKIASNKWDVWKKNQRIKNLSLSVIDKGIFAFHMRDKSPTLFIRSIIDRRMNKEMDDSWLNKIYAWKSISSQVCI